MKKFTDLTTNVRYFRYILPIAVLASVSIGALTWDNHRVQAQTSTSPRIAFTSDRLGTGNVQLFLMDPDGSNQAPLPNPPLIGGEFDGSISPDGRKIVFTNGDDIYIMNSDGSNIVDLTNDPTIFEQEPRFSPDGSRITYVAQQSDGTWDVYLMQSDGANRTNLTQNLGIQDLDPTFSPDGTKIAFASNRNNSDDIYTMDPSGGGLFNVTKQVIPFGIDEPTYSVDGKKIAYSSFRDPSWEIFIMDADGSNQTQLTSNSFNEGEPSFSPDGSKIAFLSDRTGNNDIWVMNSDGSNPVQLTNDPANDYFPSWGSVATSPTPQCIPTFSNAASYFTTGVSPAAIVVGDFTGDGHPDLLTANFDSNDISRFAGVGDGTFSPPGNIFIGATGPVALAVGDIDEDGHPDLVSANLSSSTVSILPSGVAATRIIPVGTEPESVALGDLNGDGHLDIVTANLGSDNVSVLFTPPSGGFGSPTNIAVGSQPDSVAITDLNRDGKLDIVTANSNSNDVSVLLGNGAGGFTTPTTFSVGNVPSSVAVGDFNGDGKPDLVTTNYGTSDISILLGDGAGGFGSPTSFTVGNGPSSVALADLNGDGKLDLATANQASNTISVLLGDGGGSFTLIKTITVGVGPTTIAAGDFNSDGNIDLAIANMDPDHLQQIDYVSVVLVSGCSQATPTPTPTITPSPTPAITPTPSSSPGQLDTTFDQTGYTVIGFGSGSGKGYASAIQSDGKLLVTGISYGDPAHQVFGLLRYNSDGSLDTSFNGSGKVETDLSQTDVDSPQGVAVQSDGKIIVAGYAQVTATGASKFAIVRYNTDGSLDQTFNGNGVVETGFGNNLINQAFGAAIQSDGKIVVAGLTKPGYNDSSATSIALARYNIDGSLDPTFDTDGLVTTGVTQIDSASAVAIQPDGKIVIAGGTEKVVSGVPTEEAIVIRYNADGSLDTSFYENPFAPQNGIVTVPAGTFGDASSIDVQANGEIVVGGRYTNNAGQNYYVVRLFSNGFLDNTVHTKIGSGADWCQAIRVQSDGKILAAGYSEFPQVNFTAIRYNSDLSLDTSFSGDGLLRTQFSASSIDMGHSLALQSDGKFFISGSSETDLSRFAVARYLSDGTLDSTFSSDGKTADSAGFALSEIRASVLQPDGKLLVAGSAQVTPGQTGFLLGRFDLDGTPDTTFSADGFQFTPIQGGSTAAAMALQTDGKIVVAGSCGGSMCLARYLSNGDLDTTFNPFGAPAGTIWINPGFNFFLTGASVAIQSDGKILVGGSRIAPAVPSFNKAIIMRFNSDGSPDTAFAGGTNEASLFTGAANPEFRSIKLQSDGKIVAVTDGLQDTNQDFMVARFNADGSSDNSFGSSGLALADFGGVDTVRAVELQTDGKIVVSGAAADHSKTDFAIARFNSDGSLDQTFGTSGRTKTSIGSSNDSANDIKIQPDGRILAGGFSSNPEADFAIARYNADGTLNSSLAWGNGGISTVDLGGADFANTMALYPDGRVALAGKSNGNMAIARFLGDVVPPPPTPTPTPTGVVDVSIPTGITGFNGSQINVPVTVSDTTGRSVISYDFTISYDSHVFTPDPTAFDTTNTLSSGFTVTTFSQTPGLLAISGFGTAPLSGAGTLLNLKFDVVGIAPACSSLDLPAFQFNEGTPSAQLSFGNACVISGSISGTVNYGIGQNQPGVQNVTVSAAGTPQISTATDSSGAYQLSSLGPGPYTVTPSKTGDVNGISAFDAALIAQKVVGMTTFTPNQAIAADVSGNGTVTSFDAALIAQFVVGTPNNSTTGMWRFTPTNRTYASTAVAQTGQNYTAILMGEVSGNWTPPASLRSAAKKGEKKADFAKGVLPAAAVDVKLPDISASQNASIDIPIDIDRDLQGQGILSYEVDLNYDPTVLQPSGSFIENNGTLSYGMNISVNNATPGRTRIAVFGVDPMTGVGTLLNLRFLIVGAPGQTSQLTWNRFVFNEGKPAVALANGQVTVVQMANSAATVAGRVVSPAGAPIYGARVTMTDGLGNVTTALTSPFGYFQFVNVPIGRSYTFHISSKRYVFSNNDQIVMLNGDVSNLDFFASTSP